MQGIVKAINHAIPRFSSPFSFLGGVRAEAVPDVREIRGADLLLDEVPDLDGELTQLDWWVSAYCNSYSVCGGLRTDVGLIRSSA